MNNTRIMKSPIGQSKTTIKVIIIVLMTIVLAIGIFTCANGQDTIKKKVGIFEYPSIIDMIKKSTSSDPAPTPPTDIIKPMLLPKGAFICHVKATDPDKGDYLVYTIVKGNTNYSTFRFGKEDPTGIAYQKDTTGNLYLNNPNGLYNKDGSFRYAKYVLVVQVVDSRGLKAKANITIICDTRPTGMLKDNEISFSVFKEKDGGNKVVD